MRKSRIIYILMTGVLLFLLSGGAWAYDFNDVTKVQYWKGNSQYGSGNWTDVIGDSDYFNTSGANLSGNTFTLFTNWNPSKDGYLGVKTADLFIDTDSDGSYEYAIRLDTVGQGKVYFNPVFNTSVDLFAGTGYRYGGRFDQTNPSPTPVMTTSSASGLTSVVTWTLGNGGLNNQVAVDLSGLTLVSDWSFVWGTGTCSNDAISGQVQVPEPTTMLLLGLGLVGLAGLRRKLKR